MKKCIEAAEKRLESAPQGYLRIKGKNGKVEYYCRSSQEEDRHERYLKKGEEKLAKAIAQRDYDEKLVKLAGERIKILEMFLEKEEKTSLKKLYENISHYRKVLIDAPVISDDEYAKRWQAVQYIGKTFKEGVAEIYTDRGERVRSKSEKIIADKLNSLGIPYRYECPLELKGNVKIHPDFTILKMSERKEVYLEHLGMMDDVDYVKSALSRISTYERNGIILGDRLFVTYETGNMSLNTKVLDNMSKKLLV